jgi:hypothetical protein
LNSEFTEYCVGNAEMGEMRLRAWEGEIMHRRATPRERQRSAEGEGTVIVGVRHRIVRDKRDEEKVVSD